MGIEQLTQERDGGGEEDHVRARYGSVAGQQSLRGVRFAADVRRTRTWARLAGVQRGDLEDGSLPGGGDEEGDAAREHGGRNHEVDDSAAAVSCRPRRMATGSRCSQNVGELHFGGAQAEDGLKREAGEGSRGSSGYAMARRAEARQLDFWGQRDAGGSARRVAGGSAMRPRRKGGVFAACQGWRNMRY